MISRSWHGIVPLEKASAFRDYLLKTGVAETNAIPGNLGSYIHSQSQGEWEHFFMISYWEHFEAIYKFAGPQPQIAVCYPKDDKYGLISDPIVLHQQVLSVPDEFPLLKS